MMEYKNFEVQSRVKNVESKRLHSIANATDHPQYNLNDLSRNKFLEISRFDVKINDVNFECLMSNSVSKKLYVFLSNNYKIGTDERRKQALFFRMTWHKYFSGICLNIEDPMVKKYTNIGWGGYLGDESFFYVDGVVSIVKKIASIYDVRSEEIVFIGLSSAGFAALHAAAKMQGTKCVVENPQIYIENWTDVGKLQKGLKQDFRGEQYKERLNLDEAIINNKSSRFCIFCNSASNLDYDKQLKPFLAKLGVFEVRYNYYHLDNVEIYFLNTPNGHVSWLSPLSVYMATCFDNYSDSDKEYILSMMRDMNKEKYYLRGLMIPANSNKLYRYLVTGRVDIKNIGDNNRIEILGYEGNDIRIAFPDWYKDASGNGCVVTGRQGKMLIRFKCIGRGTLNIFLRGLDIRGKNGERLPFKITFIELKINGENVLMKPNVVWHDMPFKHGYDVYDGEVFEIEAKWHLYPYDPQDLNDLAQLMA